MGTRTDFSRTRGAFVRGTAALMATVAVCQFGAVKASPGDIFASPAPAIGSAAPNATDIRDGDASVSTQTGAVQYGYPIQVPPGRNGVAPSLALSYSSQAPIYGGIAAGWSLSIPEIREDTSQGRLRTHSPEVELTQLTPKARRTTNYAGRPRRQPASSRGVRNTGTRTEPGSPWSSATTQASRRR